MPQNDPNREETQASGLTKRLTRLLERNFQPIYLGDHEALIDAIKAVGELKTLEEEWKAERKTRIRLQDEAIAVAADAKRMREALEEIDNTPTGCLTDHSAIADAALNPERGK